MRRLKPAPVLTFVVLTALLVAMPATTRGEPVYFPLDQGMFWSYEAGTGEMETMTITGTRELLGSPTTVRYYTESTSNDSLENYWTTEPDGDVLLWGFYRTEDGGWGWGYDPPIRMLDAPLFVGKTWSCTTDVYSMPSGSPRTSWAFEFTVTWEGVVSVPAGVFPSFAIGYEDTLDYDEPFHSRDGYLPDGRAAVSRPDPREWYSDGVGLTQYDYGALYELVRYGMTPVEAGSWSRVKALYR